MTPDEFKQANKVLWGLLVVCANGMGISLVLLVYSSLALAVISLLQWITS